MSLLNVVIIAKPQNFFNELCHSLQNIIIY